MMVAMRTSFVSVALMALLVAAPRAQSPDATVRALVDGPKFKQAVAFIQSDQDRFVRELVALTDSRAAVQGTGRAGHTAQRRRRQVIRSLSTLWRAQ